MEIVIAILGSSVLTALINGIIELIKNSSGRKSNADRGIMFSLLYCLQAYGEKLLTKDYIDPEDYRQFCEMYDSYKSLKGNGYAEKLKKEIDNMPIIKGVKHDKH